MSKYPSNAMSDSQLTVFAGAGGDRVALSQTLQFGDVHVRPTYYRLRRRERVSESEERDWREDEQTEELAEEKARFIVQGLT